jgi:hypothetical protein
VPWFYRKLPLRAKACYGARVKGRMSLFFGP